MQIEESNCYSPILESLLYLINNPKHLDMLSTFFILDQNNICSIYVYVYIYRQTNVTINDISMFFIHYWVMFTLSNHSLFFIFLYKGLSYL